MLLDEVQLVDGVVPLGGDLAQLLHQPLLLAGGEAAMAYPIPASVSASVSACRNKLQVFATILTKSCHPCPLHMIMELCVSLLSACILSVCVLRTSQPPPPPDTSYP